MKWIAVLVGGFFFSCARPSIAQEAPAATPAARAAFDHRHAVWNEVLRTHVEKDRFDYAKLKHDRSQLDLYLRALESVSRAEYDAWTREQRYAFWIDAYNAYTIGLVVDKYPIESIKDISTLFTEVWDQELVPLKPLFPDAKGKKLTLNDIEHRILRPTFKDARVHAAVNCASIGCPPLRNEAFVAEKLDAQLEDQARRWIADSFRNRYDRAKNRIEISKIFDWFEEDFVRDAGSVQAWVAKYARRADPPDAEWIASAKKLEIDYLDYSWKLNTLAR